MGSTGRPSRVRESSSRNIVLNRDLMTPAAKVKGKGKEAKEVNVTLISN